MDKIVYKGIMSIINEVNTIEYKPITVENYDEFAKDEINKNPISRCDLLFIRQVLYPQNIELPFYLGIE